MSFIKFIVKCERKKFYIKEIINTILYCIRVCVHFITVPFPLRQKFLIPTVPVPVLQHWIFEILFFTFFKFYEPRTAWKATLKEISYKIESKIKWKNLILRPGWNINSKYDILPSCLVHKVENCQQLLVLYTLKHLTILLHTDFFVYYFIKVHSHQSSKINS